MRFKPIVDKPECVCHLAEVVGSNGGKIHPIPPVCTAWNDCATHSYYSHFEIVARGTGNKI